MLMEKQKETPVKIYSLPAEAPAPVVDYMNFDLAKVQKDEENHKEALKNHLIEAGFKGKNTGKILSIPIADGHAQYMFAEGRGRDDGLIHLPYGDAWQSRDVQFLPRKEVILRLKQQEGMRAMFSRPKSENVGA